MLKQAANSGAVSLKGSAEVLVDYFCTCESANCWNFPVYAVNSILYQRGVYPEASFKKDVQYELSVLVAADEGLIKYLSTILAQIKGNRHGPPLQPSVTWIPLRMDYGRCTSKACSGYQMCEDWGSAGAMAIQHCLRNTGHIWVSITWLLLSLSILGRKRPKNRWMKFKKEFEMWYGKSYQSIRYFRFWAIRVRLFGPKIWL